MRVSFYWGLVAAMSLSAEEDMMATWALEINRSDGQSLDELVYDNLIQLAS